MKIINPATEEIIKEIKDDTAESVSLKFRALQNAQPDWQRTDLKQRVKIIEKFSVLLEQNIESLASTLTEEVGKPLQQSRNEVNGARSRIKWLSEHAEK